MKKTPINTASNSLGASQFASRRTGQMSANRSAKKMKMSGVTVKASPVEVATPKFIKHPPKNKNGITVGSRSDIYTSLLTGHSVSSCHTGGKVEASKLDLDETIFSPIYSLTTTNSLIALCHASFAEHRPMAITPDLLWHYISKAVAIHIHKHSEELREKFVHHKGKMTLVALTSPEPNPDEWSQVFKEFRRQIEATLTEEGKAMISGKFSTTTEVIEDVSCIALMEAMARYYHYVAMCICGVPSVTLLGTLEDWIELKTRAQHVLDLLSTDDLKGDASLSWWKPSLLSVLDKLIQCYDEPESEGNTDWMARIYKSEREGYGGHLYVCGWVNVFFPYLGQGVDAKRYGKNQWATNDLIQPEVGLKKYMEGQGAERDNWERMDKEIRGYLNSVSSYPKALSTVNFDWNKLDEVQKMMLNAGPCCVSEQTKEAGLPCAPGTLHAHFGWVMFHDSGVREATGERW